MAFFYDCRPSLFSETRRPVARLVCSIHSRETAFGFDEGLYRDYTNKLIRFGLISYPEIIERYRENNRH